MRVGRTSEGADSSRSITAGANLLLRGQLVADDEKFLQDGAAEICRERDIGSVAADGHDDAADPGNVVPGVEGIPAAAQKDFEPAAEVHRQYERDTDIAHVTGAET